MYFPIPYNLPPFYKSAVTHLLNEIKTFSDIKKQRKIFENFCRKFTMITELWEYWAWLEAQSIPNPRDDEKFQKILLKFKYRCMKHLNHEKSMKKLFTSFYRHFYEFYSINAKYLIKLIETPIYGHVYNVCRTGSHEEHISAVKNMEKLFNIPHSDQKETLKLMDKFLGKTDKNVLSIYNKNAKLYDKILAAEKNDYEWIKILAEVNDIEFLIQNVECKIAKNPGNIYLWSLYIQYLNSQNNIKVLDIYRKYCRLFIEDVETQKAYKYAIWKFNEAGYDVTEYFIDTINYEIDFGLVKNAVKLLEEALKIVKFQPKRLFTFAKKFIKKNGYEGKLKNAVKKCKLRLSKSKYSTDFEKDLKIFVEDLDPIDVALTFNENISRQYLDFPRSIYNYILDNTSYSLYCKLIKTCKFFFIQKKFVVPVWYLQCHDSLHRPPETLCYKNNLYINLTQTPVLTNPTTKTKFWIGQNFIYNSMVNIINEIPYSIYKIKPAIYQSDIEYLHIDKTTISLSDYNFLTGKGLIKEIRLCSVYVKRNDEEFAAYEDLMVTLHNAYEIQFGLGNHETCTTSMTAQKLLNFNRKEKLREFTIFHTNILLDPKIFMQFIKKNAAPKSYFTIYYKKDANENIHHFQALSNEARQLQTSWAPTEEAPRVKVYDMSDEDD